MPKFARSFFIACFIYFSVIPAVIASVTNFDYDDLHRLTRVERSDGTVTVYEYDDLGNLTAKVVTASTTTPSAMFSANQVNGSVPLQVTFTDQSIGEITSWSWDFDNNGTEDSTEQNPTYTYSTAGIYSVRLTVNGPNESDTETKTDLITITDQDTPIANFTGSPTHGLAPCDVTFTDQSTGDITSWSWDFDNDGTEDSTEQNPTYTYNIPGTYSVKLTVSGPTQYNTKLRTQYIQIDSTPLGPVLAVVPTSKNVSSQSGTATFDVGNAGMGTMNWTATANDAWLIILSGSSGTDSGTITVSFLENTGASRTGTITITADGASDSPQTVEVIQDADSGPTLSIDSPVLGAVWAIAETHNIEWTATSPYNITEIRLYLENQNINVGIATLTSNTGTYAWTIPISSNYISQTSRIRLWAVDENGDSTAAYSPYFTIQDSTAPPPPWHMPERITTAPYSPSVYISEDNTNSAIAVDNDGNVHLVYNFVEDDISETVPGGSGERYITQKIYYQKKTGTTWSNPEELYSIATTTDVSLIGSRWFSDFHIAVDSNNCPHFTWVYKGPQTAFPDCTGRNEHEIYYMAFNGASWESPINVSDNSTSSYSSTIAVDTSNNVHFVWIDGQTYLSTSYVPTGMSALYHRQKYADGSWSSVSPVVNVDYYASYPAISRGQGDQVHLVYSIQGGLEYVSWDGSEWSTRVLLSSEGDYYYDNDICVDSDNNIHIVYSEWHNFEFELQIKYILFDGTEWSAPVKLSDTDGGYSKIPSIAVSSDNSPQIVWYQNTPSYSKLFHTQKVSSNWTSPVQISTTGTYPQESSSNTVSAAISNFGILHVVWQSYYDGGDEVYYNYADVNDDQTDPQVAIIAPVAGETLNAETIYPIIWSAVDNTGVADIKIEYSIDGGVTFETITSSTENSGSYLWSVPGISFDSVQIYITATDFAGNQFTTASDQFTVNLAAADIQADFTTDVTNGLAPLSISFTDQSTGDITSWLWIFGDGSTSTEQNPLHLYSTPGTYTVSLTVSSSTNESDTETKTDYITVTEPDDSDNDGLPNYIEDETCTDPNDADTDDDGIPDGVEDANHNGVKELDETDPCDIDTDGDGIQDGTEKGLTSEDIDPFYTNESIFQLDEDPSTTTDPTNDDSDGDGMKDGVEDGNCNGRVDEGETDPTGADRYVSNGGSNLTGVGTSDSPWQTIQFSIDRVSEGATIHVSGGAYTGAENKNIDFRGKAITLRAINGPEATIIDCEGNSRGFYFHSGEGQDSIVSGFTIRNGLADIGGGIYCVSSSPRIDYCILTNNSAALSIEWASVSASIHHTVGVKTDGTLWTWGDNSYGQLGDGTTVSKSVPIQIGTDTDWASVSASGDYWVGVTAGVKTDGTLWAWGDNSYGQLGDGTTVSKSVPIQIGTDTNWASVSASWDHMAGIKTDGTLWAWGDNSYGQLGDGTTVSKSVPIQIGSDNDWATVSAGNYHTVGVKTDGTLWAWGDNYNGQLGDGTTVSKSVPTRIGADNNWATVSPGWFHTVGVKTDGTLWAWGDNSYGQLGDGTTVSKSVPTRIGADNDWADVSANWINTLGVRTDRSLWAWGDNSYGQLGDGTTVNKSVPTRIGSDNDWVDVSAGLFHTAGVKTDRSLWAWGDNSYGQLGDGTWVDKTVPIQIGTDTDWAAVSAGRYHTVGVNKNGSLWAWGDNYHGQLGDGTTANKSAPIQIGTDTDWADVSAGNYHTAGVKTDGTLWAWGNNDYGQLGDGTTVSKSAPIQIGTDTDWASVSAGGGGDCTLAVKTDGTLWAWGSNFIGQLGDGTTVNRGVPTQIGNDSDWASVSAGGSHTAGVKTDGTLWAWGNNYYGQLGDGTWAPKSVPTKIGTDTDWASVSANWLHTAAVKADGTLWAWGNNFHGQLGDGTTVNRSVPTKIGTDSDWAAVSSGLFYTVAVKTDGTLWAWGGNMHGQLGDGTTASKGVPTKIGTDIDWANASAGRLHTVGVKTDGTLWAWGNNSHGQLGDGTTAASHISPTSLGTDGGAIYCYCASLVIDHCTIASNEVSGKGAGIYCYSSSPTIKNTIFWGNTSDQIFVFSGAPVITYTDIEGGYLGEGNIDSDPEFVDFSNGDYRLGPGSPCVDTGDPASPLDPDGSRTDMGAIFQSEIIDTDGDGLADEIEAVLGTDPLDPDTDNDGLLDGTEDANHNGSRDPGETDACDWDSDDDKMPDGWEVAHGLDPLLDDASGDKDGDGFSNLREYVAGTNPDDIDEKPYFEAETEDFETGDFSRFPWLTTGDALWSVTTTNPYNLTYSAQAGVITDNQSTSLEICRYTEAGDLSFWYAVDSEAGYDFLNFYLDGALTDQWSGQIPYTQAIFPLTTGMHHFRWEYLKDKSDLGGNDTAWIDTITFPGSVDTDGDGMPDGWEIENDLDPLVDDSCGDADGDLFTNHLECLLGTDPCSSEDCPTLTKGFDADLDVDGLDLIRFMEGLDTGVVTEEEVQEFAEGFGSNH